MKTYIAPEIIEIEVNASELMQTSPKDQTIRASEPGDDATGDGDFAAGSYRNSLWND